MHIGRQAAIILIVILILCIATAGCFGARNTPVPNPSAPTIVVEYNRSGGLAGLDDRLVIFDNGVAVVATKTVSRQIVLNASDVARISDLFREAGFTGLQENYPAHHGADLLHYSVTYGNKTVALEETAYPEAMQPVIKELDRILTL